MNSRLRKLVKRQLSRIPAVLCLLAVAMQVAVPVLHRGHDSAFETVEVAASPSLQASADHGAAGSRHDAASCSQCRLVSQLRTLSPLSTLVTLSVLRTDWVVDSTRSLAISQANCDSGSPRAPPGFSA